VAFTISLQVVLAQFLFIMYERQHVLNFARGWFWNCKAWFFVFDAE